MRHKKTANLNLTIKKKWFDMIASGEKREEYREMKEYWLDRLVDINTHDWKHFDTVTFRNGYGRNVPTVTVEYLGISFMEGMPSWGADPGVKYIVIRLGEILDLKQ